MTCCMMRLADRTTRILLRKARAWFRLQSGGVKMGANVSTAKASENLAALSFCTFSLNAQYDDCISDYSSGATGSYSKLLSRA